MTSSSKRIEVSRENVSFIDGEPVFKTCWRFRCFEVLCGCEGDVAERYSLADAMAECQIWLDRGVSVFPAVRDAQ